MRHNKMAGNSEFLLGKKMPDEELAVFRKRKPSTFTNGSNAKVNAVKHLLHSKSTYFYRWSSIVTGVCGVALLCGFGFIFNPITNDGKINKVFAETITANPTDYSSISMTLSNNGTELDNEDTVSTNATPGLVSYIDNNIKISTSKIDRFYVTVQAAEDSNSSLTGTAHGETIAPVDTDTSVTSFSDNTWGYALGEVNTANVDFVYNPLPEYNTVTKPQYSSNSGIADGDYNLKLTFAAKINADKPSDHYTTKAMVSVAADARYISGFINLDTDQPITTMQEMTSSICKNAPDGYSTQLIDDKTASGAGQKTYWVTKIGAQCIMTQNLDLDIPETGLKAVDTDLNGGTDWDANSEHKPAATMAGTSWTWINSVNNVLSYNPGEYIINDATTSWDKCNATKDPSVCNRYTAISSSTPDTDLHYAVGNYYSYNAATAGTGPVTANGQSARDSICPKGWKLFDYSGAKSFDIILTGKNQTTIRQGPTFFPAAGFANFNGLGNVGAAGTCWSSTRLSDGLAYSLYFASSFLNLRSDNARQDGHSVRCVAK